MNNYKNINGPWKRDGKLIFVEDYFQSHICTISDAFNDEISEANAKLISAAPELLEALLIIINDDPTFLEIPKVEQAINKATE